MGVTSLCGGSGEIMTGRLGEFTAYLTRMRGSRFRFIAKRTFRIVTQLALQNKSVTTRGSLGQSAETRLMGIIVVRV